MAKKPSTGNSKIGNDILRSLKSGYTMKSSTGKVTEIKPKPKKTAPKKQGK